MARRLAWVLLAIAGIARAADPVPTPPTQFNVETGDELDLAAACIDRGDETAAASHLARHLVAHPDRTVVRFSLGELLWRRERFPEAAVEYTRFVRDTPPRPATVSRLIHAYTRLVSCAEHGGDAYAEHLHRGIGLYLVACREPAAAEDLLCKAAGELSLASLARPAEARPHWYLHLAWSQLAQSQPAARHLRRATDLAEHSDLAPHERGDLAAAR